MLVLPIQIFTTKLLDSNREVYKWTAKFLYIYD